jgi:ABC-2 type transport system permease protein
MGITTNQFRSAFIISRYSLLAMLRSPTSIVFSLLFPVIFITVFGSIIGDQAPVMKVALAPGSDTVNMLFPSIEAIPAISLQRGLSPAAQLQELKKGDIVAVLHITPDPGAYPAPHYTIHLQSASSSGQKLQLLTNLLDKTVRGVDQQLFPGNASIATIAVTKSTVACLPLY